MEPTGVRVSRAMATLFLLLALTGNAHAGRTGIAKFVPRPLISLGVQTRRLLNFSNLFGTPTNSKTPYDRILGNPVFQVTTAWGSTYMTNERKSGAEVEATPPSVTSAIFGDGITKPKSVMDDQGGYKTIAVFYMDPDDAMSQHAELMQLDQMKEDPNADIRITSCSMGKAIRQAANIHELGLVTGNEINKHTGRLKPTSEGGVLRYKILPSQRQLYYAARCYGRERVGLGFTEGGTAAQEAVTALMGCSAVEANNVMRRQKQQDNTSPKLTPMQAQNAHMDGHTGIPVFYAPYLHRKIHPLRRIISGKPHKYEIPLFFNYEDLEVAWRKVSKGVNANSVPPDVEVFNLWDVLTSMDKERFRSKPSWGTDPKKAAMKTFLEPVMSRVKTLSPKTNAQLDLNDITFVPSSRCASYKERLSSRGNGKARLRPMR